MITKNEQTLLFIVLILSDNRVKLIKSLQQLYYDYDLSITHVRWNLWVRKLILANSIGVLLLFKFLGG